MTPTNHLRQAAQHADASRRLRAGRRPNATTSADWHDRRAQWLTLAALTEYLIAAGAVVALLVVVTR